MADFTSLNGYNVKDAQAEALLIDNACKNLFDYDKWVGTTVRNGTAIYENYGVTLTANGPDCYTSDRADQTSHTSVQANKNYILSWDCSSENSDLTKDRVFVFFTGVQTNNRSTFAINKQLQFTVPNDIDFITVRFGVQENGNTVSYSNIMLRRAEVTDSTFEPYYRSQKQLDTDLTTAENDIKVLKSDVNYNLLRIPTTVQTRTTDGVTFTVNKNEAGQMTSIVANGTSTATNFSSLLISGDHYDFLSTQDYNGYWVTGSPSNSLSSTYCMIISYYNNEKKWRAEDYITNNNNYYIKTDYPYFELYVGIKEGYTANNLTFYPMITKPKYAELPFKPYVPTNTELAKEVQEIETFVTDTKDYIGYTDNDIYGLEVDYENNKFTRLAGSINKTGGNDFNNVNAYGGRRRCNLTDNGIVTAYYGDAAYTETGALTQAVTVNGTEYPVGTSVQVMVEQPKFYYKVVPLKLESYTTQNGDIGYHIRKAAYYVADTPKNGFKLHPAFIRNGAEKEKIYLSAYEGCLYDTSASAYITDDAQVADFNTDKMSSIANVKPMSGLTQNLTRGGARKLAQNRGTGWEQMYVHTASASQLLLMVEYGTLNSQTAIGNGVVNKATGSGNEAENTGGTSSLGNASGSVSNSEVSYRGEENIWGNIWKYEDGINILNPNPFNDGEYGNVYIADNGFANNINTLPYEDTNIYPCKASSSFISAFGYNEKFDWLFIPTEVIGNSSLPVGDMLWNANTAWRVAELGGNWDIGSKAGVFVLYLYHGSSDYIRAVGSRLVYIPDAEEIGQNITTLAQQLQALTARVEALENG